MRFLLSIHDVWPGNFPEVEGHCRQLRSLGVARIALMVVPLYHGRRPIGAEKEFLAWLGEKAAEGCEVFLHGFRHLMPERAEGDAFAGRRSLFGRWVNRHTGGEAEFCGLPVAEREGLLRQGGRAFREAGLPLRGFVAPTWHGAPPLPALRELGFGLWETRFRLRQVGTGEARWVPPLAWSQEPGREPALAGGAAWLGLLLRLPLIKVALHPGDLRAAPVVRTLERVLAGGKESGYADVFAP